MPTLNWIGKDAVLDHHTQVQFHLLRCDPGLSAGDPNSGNLLVEGDNLLALKALLPRYAGQVKCIYIDPPYNTGNENWVYNDNVNSPEIREWLGRLVGSEAEDLSRHDKWLCMMYPRLVLLRELLDEKGSLWMSIDDNEMHHARAVLDEIFGQHNFVSGISWEKAYAPKSSAKHLSDRHEYILLYAKNKDLWERNLLPRTEKQNRNYKNPDNDPRGPWRPNNLAARNYYSRGTYSIKCPNGRIIPGPPKGSYWRVSEERLWEMDAEGRIWWGNDGNNVPAPKIYLSEVKQGVVPETIWFYQDVGHSQEGKKEILKILPDIASVFTTPKPTRLIQRILQIATNPGDLVLDSFAGSGTTGHAVLKMNQETPDLTPALWEDYVDCRLANGLSPVTVNGELRELLAFLHYLNDLGRPVQRRMLKLAPLKEAARLPRDLPVDDLRRLRQQVVDQAEAEPSSQQREAVMDRAWFLLMLYCGLRTGEVRRLRLDDLDLADRRVRIEQSKGLKDRVVWIGDEAFDALQAYLAVREQTSETQLLLFRHKPLSVSYCGERLRTYGRRCGVKATPHQLRHSFATLLINARVPVEVVQKLMGHKNIDTTLIYTRLYDHTVADDYYRAMGEIEAAVGAENEAGASPNSLLALIDALQADILTPSQQETVQALRAAVLAMDVAQADLV